MKEQEKSPLISSSLKSLSSGLGFYEKQTTLSTPLRDAVFRSKEKTHSLPEEGLNLEDEQSYERLLFLLEKPWLEKKNEIENEIPKGDSVNEQTLPGKHTSIPKSSLLPAHDFIQPENKDSTPLFEAESETQKVSSDTWIRTQIKSPLPVETQDHKEPTKGTSHRQAWFFSSKSLLIDSIIAGILFFSPLVVIGSLFQYGFFELFLPVRYKVFFAFLLFTQMYCLICRLFCFETFGEAFTHRRLYADNNKPPSPLLLFWRFILSCLTGCVSLPVLSFIFKRDLQGYLTGMYFQRKHSGHTLKIG